MVAAPALPPTAPGSPLLAVRWVAQRLWIGPFLVPDYPFFVRPPCCVCRGPVFHDDGSFRCFMCAREHVVAAITGDGRVSSLALQGAVPTSTVRRLPLAHRDARARSRREGVTGFQARILRLVPREQDSHVAVETLVGHLAAPRGEIRRALDQLTDLGLLERFAFAGGYRSGWRRPSRAPTEEPPP